MNAPVWSLWKCAQVGIETYLGSYPVEVLVHYLEETTRSWRHHFGPSADLDKCAPLVLMSAALFYRTTGRWAWESEDEASLWIRQCQSMIADAERTRGHS